MEDFTDFYFHFLDHVVDFDSEFVGIVFLDVGLDVAREAINDIGQFFVLLLVPCHRIDLNE
jgi:hypothetical protein